MIMIVLSAVANSIFDCVQFTVEYPSKNENGKVPILDLEVAVQDNQMTHEHYEKPCAAKMVIGIYLFLLFSHLSINECWISM